MSAQAEQMNEYVAELVVMVGASSAVGHVQPVTGDIRKNGKKTAQLKLKALTAPGRKRKEPNPEDVIPLDDDFKDL